LRVGKRLRRVYVCLVVWFRVQTRRVGRWLEKGALLLFGMLAIAGSLFGFAGEAVAIEGGFGGEVEGLVSVREFELGWWGFLFHKIRGRGRGA